MKRYDFHLKALNWSILHTLLGCIAKEVTMQSPNAGMSLNKTANVRAQTKLIHRVQGHPKIVMEKSILAVPFYLFPHRCAMA